MDIRVSPHDPELEASVVGACALTPGFLEKIVSLLKPEHFYLRPNRIIYRAIVDLFSQGKEHTAVMDLHARLKETDQLDMIGGTKKLASMLEFVPALSGKRAADYAHRLKTLWQVRQLISSCQEIAARGYITTETEDIDQLLREASDKIYEISSGSGGDRQESFFTIKEAVNDLAKRMNDDVHENVEGKVTRPRFGFEGLDKKLGGIDFGEFAVIAARPSMGKSSLMYCIAANVARQTAIPQIAVHIISAETKAMRVAASMISQSAKFPISKFQTLDMQPDDWKKMIAGAGDVSKLPITIDETTAPSIAHIRASVRRASSFHLKRNEQGDVVQRLGLVMLDYIQLCESEIGKGDSREQAVGRVARLCHAIGKDYNVGVIALSQLNREVETRQDKRPQMSDIRNSGEIEQAADKIIALYRGGYYSKDGEDNIAEAIVLKSKQSSLGVVKLHFAGEYVLFSSLAEEEYE